MCKNKKKRKTRQIRLNESIDLFSFITDFNYQRQTLRDLPEFLILHNIAGAGTFINPAFPPPSG